LQLLNIGYKNLSSSGTNYYINRSDANVGDIIDFNTSSTTITRVIIIATYKDNSKKVLFNQEV